MRILVCLMLLAVVAGGCGGDDKAQRATDPDTVGLPQEERDYVACLRKAGIKVRVPAAVRRLARQGNNQKRTRSGKEGRPFLFFYLLDRRQRATQSEIAAARTCRKERSAATQFGATRPQLSDAETSTATIDRGLREVVDALGAADPELKALGKDQVSVALPGLGPERFRPDLRSIYHRERAACQDWPPRSIARRYGIKAWDNRVLFAEPSKSADPLAAQAALEGCLAGFGVE